MTVLDTHVWLWWVSDDPRLSRAARETIEASPEIGIATISVWEASTLDRLGRIRLLPDVRTWVRRALAHERVVALPLTAEIAAAGGMLGSPFPGDPADRIVYATAVQSSSLLVTGDRRLQRHDPTRVVW